MYNVILKDSQETEAPASQELFGQESDREQTVPMPEKLLKDMLKDIRKFINANQFIKHNMFMFFFGLEYFCLLTVTLSAKKIIFSRKLKI